MNGIMSLWYISNFSQFSIIWSNIQSISEDVEQQRTQNWPLRSITSYLQLDSAPLITDHWVRPFRKFSQGTTMKKSPKFCLGIQHAEVPLLNALCKIRWNRTCMPLQDCDLLGVIEMRCVGSQVMQWKDLGFLRTTCSEDEGDELSFV